MIITERKYFSSKELFKKLKDVVMLEDYYTYVYRDTYMSNINIDPNSLFPCQFYISKKELDSKIQLQEAFREKGCDILNLDGYCEFKLNNEPIYRTILPPIIEESIEADGKIYPLINDGMHRIYLAKLQKRRINIVYIRGSKKPYYAYPLPNGWADVRIVNEINKNLIKKIHRIQDNKKLYRNFDSVFHQCSSPRGCQE